MERLERRQTLWDLVHALGQRLRRHHEALFAQILEAPVIGLDRTEWKRPDKKGAKPWQMWCLTAADVVSHRICDDEGAKAFEALVGYYDGVIVCDVSSMHTAGARDGTGIALGAAGLGIGRPRDPRSQRSVSSGSGAPCPRMERSFPTFLSPSPGSVLGIARDDLVPRAQISVSVWRRVS